MERERILVVDDNATLAEVIADVLDARGYCVTVANDGFEAVALARDDDVDILGTKCYYIDLPHKVL